MINLQETLVYDIEGDNLYPDITKVHCISCIDYNQKVLTFYTVPEFVEHLIKVQPKVLACHNQFGYDLHVLKKFSTEVPFEFSVERSRVLGFECFILDTLSLSRRLNPDRALPWGCPNKVQELSTGKSKTIGAHGLDAWAYRTGCRKPIIFDWSNKPLEVYVERCEEDVKNNWKALEMMLKEIP